MKHTPEPWVRELSSLRKPGAMGYIVTADHEEMNEPQRIANAKRVESCVNALAGLNPEGVRACVDALEKCESALIEEINAAGWDEAESNPILAGHVEAIDAARAALEKVRQ